MNITAIIFAAVVVGGVGILIGFFLGVAYSKQEKDFQINLLLCNLNFAIGYKFKQKGVK